MTTKSTNPSKDDQQQVEKIEAPIIEPLKKEPVAPAVVNQPVDKLLTVLYWVWDSADRSGMKVFYIGSTARAIKENKDLEGDRILCGIRKLEWNSGGRRIFDVCMGKPVDEDNERAKYNNSGVDVYLYFFDEEPEITTLDTVYYRYENFWIPTPLDGFERKHEHLWKLQ